LKIDDIDATKYSKRRSLRCIKFNRGQLTICVAAKQLLCVTQDERRLYLNYVMMQNGAWGGVVVKALRY
jgi:hypothetical protein